MLDTTAIRSPGECRKSTRGSSTLTDSIRGKESSILKESFLPGLFVLARFSLALSYQLIAPEEGSTEQHVRKQLSHRKVSLLVVDP